MNYILGNPPFIGQKERSKEQTADLKHAWGGHYQGYFDFVTGWYAKSVNFFSNKPTGQFAFVSTNSITQGVPVAGLFKTIFDQGWKIKFAHRTFAWDNDAPGAAKVHCVIIGLSQIVSIAKLFIYKTPKSEPVVTEVKPINAYLVNGPMLYIDRRNTPISPELPPLTRGSQASDWGFLTVTPEQYDEVKQDPIASKYLRPFVGGVELIQSLKRWCIWIDEVNSDEVEKSLLLKNRLSMVKEKRLESDKKATQALALTPGIFAERRQPTEDYLAVPNTFSENRHYITASRLPPDTIAGVKLFTAPDPDGFLFAVISTRIFMVWQKTIGGRLKHDPSFSNTLVWNNFPFPVISQIQRQAISGLGKNIQIIRDNAENSSKSLKELYNPLAMPTDLVKAHKALDKCVDSLYRKKPFKDDAERVAHLFEMYAELVERKHL